MSNVISICPSKSLHFQSDLTGLPIVHPNLICKMGFVVPNYLAHSKKIRGVRGENIKALASYSEEGSAPGALDSFPVSVELELISSESQYDQVIAEAHQLEESVVILWMASWCRKCIYLKPKLEKLAADYYSRTKCRSNKMIEKIDFMLIPTRNLPIQFFEVTPRRLRESADKEIHKIKNQTSPTSIISLIRFYCIDVNNVPHKLVVRAGVTKMPTIQLWKDSKKQAEVIGGHKAYLVVSEVREMIESAHTM